MIEPYVFVRAITLGLGALWAIFWFARIIRFERRWRVRLEPLKINERRWRRWIAVTFLRATLLDPINLALMFLLAGLWTLHRFE